MANRRVGLDLDGCLVDWNPAFARLLAEAHGSDLLPEGWQSMGHEAFPCWDWYQHYGYPAVSVELARHNLYEDVTFWHKLDALPEAQEVLDVLAYCVDADEIDLYFITQRGGCRVKQQTEMWLYDRGITTPTVLVTGDKVPVIQGLGLEFYIDDRLDTMEAALAAGCPGIYLLDRPWNRTKPDPGLPVVYSVAEAMLDAWLWVDLSAV